MLWDHPWAVVVGSILGCIAGGVAPDRPAVGAGGRAAAGQVHGPARAGAVLDHPRHRPGLVLDRSANHHHQLRRRADAHLGHRAGERGRRAVLDGLRPREGGARGPGLQARGELGGADRAPRHHRPHAADRAPPRPRADRGAAPEADRRAVQSLGRHGPIGRDARRDHPRVVAGRHVARGPGGAREGGADHPRPGRGRDRPPVRPGRRSRTSTTRPRFTCGR